MGNYAVAFTDAAVTVGFLTAGNVVRGASKRAKIYDFVVSAEGPPADNVLQLRMRRSTTAGTLTAVTPDALDPADGASVATAGEDATIEPTYTADSELMEMSFNQRATYRWVAAPGGELVIPDTASNGIGFEVKSPAYTGPFSGTTHFSE